MSSPKSIKKNPPISLIIPCFNGAKYIKTCLKAIFDSTWQDFELICIDDGSTDASSKIFKSLDYKFKLITNPSNLGASASRNLGAKLSRSELLLFLDIDTVIAPDCLANLIAFLANQPTKTAAQIALTNPGGKTYESMGHFLSPFGFPYEKGVSQKIGKTDQPELILGGRTAGLAVTQKMFDQIGGFDANYQIYGEDTDFCWRLWLNGGQLYFLPQAKAIHGQKSSLNPQTYERIFSQGIKNNLHYLLKNLDFKHYGYILILFTIANFFLFLKQLLCAKFNYAGAILKAWFWNLINLRKTLKKRSKNNFLPASILMGNLNLKIIFIKAWRWLKIV